MAEITVVPLSPRQLLVHVHESGHQTEHRVTVPDRIGGKIDLRGQDPERVVRESFDFLLEREPATSILSEFSLDDIPRYFPEYAEELARRLG
jgi:hypothetical protein